MHVQKIFQAGNSNVVAIPKNISKELGLRKGKKVVVDKTPDGKAIVIRKAESVRRGRLKADVEFKKWWDLFLKENAEILDELAIR